MCKVHATSIVVEVSLKVRSTPHTQIIMSSLYNDSKCGHLSIFRNVFLYYKFGFFKSGNFFIGKHILYY
jgi:hypothetical protein